MEPARTRSFYLAGELFSGKHLLGNAALADAIRRRSSGRYAALLPQNLEQREGTAHSVRDNDLRALLACDLALFNFDGGELDSGTVVEFLFAKFADIPAVLLRTDFRRSGDQLDGGEPWNLMVSFYPRTATVLLNSMALYQSALDTRGAGSADPSPENGTDSSVQAALDAHTAVADAVVKAFDEILLAPPVLPAHLRAAVYEWLAILPGFQPHLLPEMSAELPRLAAVKAAAGLL